MLGANSTTNERGIEKLNEILQYMNEQNLIQIFKQIKLGSLIAYFNWCCQLQIAENSCLFKFHYATML
jgi:hypothetical protein